MTKPEDIYNETTNTAGGITTPADQEDCASTDMISNAVAEMMDRIQEDFIGEPEDDKRQHYNNERNRV
ncbi:hypothetical protein ACFQ88_03665 [Paenibacillus sp. NPDC056579]|uniref:hypothetical protein n=1 Tax=unclassified Paenibacillus TaxID=185978 RepID=UPI001EF86705|nr:hypothetical protein [Paenibacillus sp. H1-7]ULL16117.1 hypothetical protein DVH26_17665 [Paenibacillus sp. H1-7]